ncbi:putative kinesin [Leptomonas pyrrhocoris]|uniref:Putative kinesin n=1 Tax=Leptomonas pyrrhocoris TaxID=157538 RepID=A0A0N0DV18_LEPPY|nr:putative kinesin [Leptomonas pyrrhocoris]KPA79714.1 putative kinesin [Leptomonas pyrrhocoris]|eukprot:XP_015658153.1 putative kinesin [Leptomonas pyrrhocoris]
MSSSSIKVAIRCRPLLGQERPTGGLDIQSRRILLDSKTYDPDYTFPPTATQDDVYHACRPILQCVKEGMNGTIMVYGQTGTGKTYTMLGNDAAEHGLVHNVVAEMLDYVQQKTIDGDQCAITLSMIEIYNERLTDMLSPNGDEEVTLISGFPRFTHKVTLCRVNDAIETIQRGLAWRHTAATLMNDRSSRSHVVFIFDLEEYNAFTDQTDVAHLFMIDLAGSESVKKSLATGVAAGEAGKINKSLLALKSVFLALSNTNEATRPSHVPYRDSKLTELLQDSIGGTARTLMIACISSVGRDIEETKSTLLYAVKARSIRNAANTEKEKLLVRLRSMEVENQKLRNRLQERVNERGGYYVTKEEHEQTQETAESYGKMKEAVEQLMQDRQNSDARQHICESQVRVLHALLEDKAAELESFKEVYAEALKRFESQASTLQRVVRGGVGEAKEAVQRSFAENYARLHAWRTELLSVLEEPLPTTMPTLPEERAVEEDEQQQQQRFTQEDTTVHPGLADRSATPPPGLTPHTSPMRNEIRCSNGNGNNPSSSTAHAGLYVAPSTSSTTTAAAGVGGGQSLGAARSARGSAASMQRVSAASAGTTSASVSPTRRGGTRPRGGGASSSYNASRRATQTSPSLAACHHPPMAPPSSLPASTAVKDEHAAVDECGGAVAVVVAASSPLQPGGKSGAASPTCSPIRLPPSPSQPVVRTQELLPSWSAVLAQHDAQCTRTVHRLNEAVVAVLEGCLVVFEQYKSHADGVEDKRRRGLQEVCQRLRGELESQLTQLQRIDAAGERELRDAREALSEQLQLKMQLRPTAEATPFQQTLRSACNEVVRHAMHAFPHPSTPAPAEAAMDVIVHNVQRCSTAFTVQALDPLSSSAVALNAVFAGNTTTSCTSSASAPLANKAAATTTTTTTGTVGNFVWSDLAPMPRLSPPLLSDAATAVGGGRQRDRSSATPAGPEQEEEGESSSTVSTSSVRETRRTTVPIVASSLSLSAGVSVAGASPRQRVSARASSRRSSVALSAMPVNRVSDRGGQSSPQQRHCKRTRSNVASQRGDGSSRHTTMMRRTLR